MAQRLSPTRTNTPRYATPVQPKPKPKPRKKPKKK